MNDFWAMTANILWKSVYKLKYNSYFCKNLVQNGWKFVGDF